MIYLVCIFCTSQVFGFRVDNPFYGNDHINITQSGLSKYVYSFEGNLLNTNCKEGKCTFSEKAQADIAASHIALDVYGLVYPEPILHCDNEMITECSLVIKYYRYKITKGLIGLSSYPPNYKETDVIKDIENLRENLGHALHTLQDFYSHSNWVEMQIYGTDKKVLNDEFVDPTPFIIPINGNLYDKSVYAVPHTDDEHACISGPAYNSEDDRYNELNLSKLTSGYYFKRKEIYNGNMYCNVPSLVSPDSNICILPNGTEVKLGFVSELPFITYTTHNGLYIDENSKEKCVHGSSGNSKSYIGIAKDHPDKPLHHEAAGAAISATAVYVKTIIDDVKTKSGNGAYTDWAILKFLGHDATKPKPEPPSNAIIEVQDDIINISFNKARGANEYIIYRKKKSEGQFEKIDTIAELSYTDSNTEPGIEYCYQIKSSNNIGESDSGTEEQCVTIPGKPQPPSDVILEVKNDAINISFTEVKEAQEYVIYRKDELDELFNKIDTITEFSYTDSSAKSGVEYCYQVRSLNDIGESDAGAEEQCATIPDTDCVKDNITGLTWEKKTNDGGLRDAKWTYMNTTNLNGADDPRGDDDNGNCLVSQVDSDGIYCHTEGYVKAVNKVGLCGLNNWKVPTIKELETLVSQNSRPHIDTNLFPLTNEEEASDIGIISVNWWYWSSTRSDDVADYMNFDQGWSLGFGLTRYNALRVRLVSSGR